MQSGDFIREMDNNFGVSPISDKVFSGEISKIKHERYLKTFAESQKNKDRPNNESQIADMVLYADLSNQKHKLSTKKRITDKILKKDYD